MKRTHHMNTDRDGLNIREKLFCYLYLANQENGSQAAREAGYRGDVGKRSTILLSRPHVAAVISRERNRLVAKAQLNAERVLDELMRIAFFDCRRLFRSDNSLIPLAQLDKDTAAVISGADFRKGTLRLRFADNLRALDLLGRYLKMWDGAGDSSSDRLREVLNAFRSGPVADKKETIQ